jgi:hypothetical protein
MLNKDTQTKMATRGRIGIQLKNGSILSVYSHWDNYPEWSGKKLKEHFNTREKVAALIDGGDISALWTDKDWDGKEMEFSTLYYSGRGDTDVEPKLSESFQDFIKYVNDSWGDYAYLFTNGEWKCYTPKGNEEMIPA